MSKNTHQQAFELIQAGELHAAKQLCNKLITKNQRDANALDLLSLIEMNCKNYSKATKLIKKAINIEPNNAIFHCHLGILLSFSGDATNACQKYREAIQLNSDYVHAYCLLINEKPLDTNDPLIKNVEHLLQTDLPTPFQRCTLAETFLFFGNFAFVEKQARQAISEDLNCIQAYMLLSDINAIEPGDTIINDLERILQNKSITNINKRYLYFLIANYYDKNKEHSKAFVHYQAGNKAANLTFNTKKNTDGTNRIIKCFTRELLESQKSCGNDSDAPIFIVGMPRSGTSLVEQILSGHSQITGGGELPYIKMVGIQLSEHASENLSFPECLPYVDKRLFKAFANDYLKLNEKLLSTAHFTDKTPINYNYVGLILLLFPNAKIIHCKRHPLDTCLSCYFSSFKRGNEYTFNLEDLAIVYENYHRMMQHWKSIVPTHILDISYEELVNHQEDETKKLLNFIGLDLEKSCLEFYKQKRKVDTASVWQVRQPIYQSSINRFQPYLSMLEPLTKKLEKIIVEYTKG